MSTDSRGASPTPDMIAWIRAQVDAGHSRKDIRDNLMRNGYDGPRADAFISAATRGESPAGRPLPDSESERREEKRSKSLKVLRQLGMLIVLFVVANAVLWAGQELWHREDVQRCEQLDKEMAEIKADIDYLEQFLKERTAERMRIEQMERGLGRGVSYDRYNEMVDRYNAGVAHAGDELTRYRMMVEDYNRKATEYDELAGNAYRRFYLIPLPGLGKGRARARH